MIVSEKDETKRLIITDSIIEESDELQAICNKWDDKFIIEGSNFESDYIHKCLTEGDLPPIPDASKDYYKLKSIYLKDTGKLIGFSDIYYGFPSEETAWISIFIIDKQFRKKGYAQEAIDFISDECVKKGYKNIGIAVHLKNWSALRFWTKAGFNRVMTVFGDNGYSEKAYALIGLEKSLAD